MSQHSISQLVLLIDLLTHSLIVFILSHMTDSNRRPTHYECVALPTELKWHFYYWLLTVGFWLLNLPMANGQLPIVLCLQRYDFFLFRDYF